jgi:replicative DNA helicase Mcm
MEEFMDILFDFLSEHYEKDIKSLKTKQVLVDYNVLKEYRNGEELAEQMEIAPSAFLKAMTKAVQKFRDVEGNPIKKRVSIVNLPKNKKVDIENIRKEHLNKLIAVEGIVSRRGGILSRASFVQYVCSKCEEIYKVPIEVGKPLKCEVCESSKLRKKGVLEKEGLVDHQKIEIQEFVEKTKPGAQASKLICVLEDDLVNSVNAGDVVEVIGILKERETKSDGFYDKILEVSHIEKINKDISEEQITDTDMQQIIEFSKNPNLEQEIIRVIAPNVYGYEHIKLAIALQLFGGKKCNGQRDFFHILLIGDPGTAKTKILQEVRYVMPKSIYVSGKNSTGVGLTASVEKDELSGGGWTLKAGAIILASGGMVMIDEFNQIDDEERSYLHEVMESGTLSIAKAGITANFKVKTSILAAANPKLGRFIESKNLADQFDIPITLLSRFDLIFPIRDTFDADYDEKLFDYIDRIRSSDENTEKERARTLENKVSFIRKYISYARNHINPMMTEEAKRVLKSYYMALRGKSKDGTVAITQRYIEVLFRLAEAHAKMRLSNKVEAIDAEVAVRLVNKSLEDTVLDKKKGVFDVDTIAVGITSSERELFEKMEEIYNDLKQKYETFDMKFFIEKVKEQTNEDEEKIRFYAKKFLF